MYRNYMSLFSNFCASTILLSDPETQDQEEANVVAAVSLDISNAVKWHLMFWRTTYILCDISLTFPLFNATNPIPAHLSVETSSWNWSKNLSKQFLHCAEI